MNSPELTGVQVEESGPNNCNITISIPVGRIMADAKRCSQGAVVFRNFKDRGRCDTKYSFSQEEQKVRMEIPKSKLNHDKTLYKIAQQVQNSCRQATRVYQDLFRNSQSQKLCKLQWFDVISCDFSIIFPEYENRQVFFRYSNIQLASGMICMDKSDSYTERKIAISYVPDDFYNSPKLQIYDDTAMQAKSDFYKFFRILFCMSITLMDLHFIQKLIDRRQYPAWHLKLVNYFYMKVFKGSVLSTPKRFFTLKVNIEEGGVDHTVTLLRQDEGQVKELVKIKIFREDPGTIEEKNQEFYHNLKNYLLELPCELKNLLYFDKGRFGIKIQNRQLFEAAMLGIYKYVHFYTQLCSVVQSNDKMITMISTPQQPRQSQQSRQRPKQQPLFSDKLKITLNNIELLLRINLKKQEYSLEAVLCKNQQTPADTELNEQFKSIFGEYISNMFNTATLRYNARKENLELTYESYVKFYKQCPVDKQGKFNQLLKKIFVRLNNEPRMEKYYRGFWIEGKSSHYELVFRVYELKFGSRYKNQIRISTNFDEVWSQKEKRKIDDVEIIERDLKIDQLIL